jgi:hypothetical protein
VSSSIEDYYCAELCGWSEPRQIADRCSCRAVIRRVDELDNVHCPQHGAYAEIARLRAENERLKVEYDEATQALAAELADERTLTNRLRAENERLREALTELADRHHRTIRGSRLHDPERLDWSECPARSCSLARGALASDEPVAREET